MDYEAIVFYNHSYHSVAVMMLPLHSAAYAADRSILGVSVPPSGQVMEQLLTLLSNELMMMLLPSFILLLYNLLGK